MEEKKNLTSIIQHHLVIFDNHANKIP